MVQPREDVNNTLSRERPPKPEPSVGRAPYPGEVVGHDAPPYDVVGVDALSPLLLHVSFPATKDAIARSIGAARVPVDAQRSISVAAILDLLGPATFESRRDLEAAAKRAWVRVRDEEAGHAGERGGRNRQRD